MQRKHSIESLEPRSLLAAEKAIDSTEHAAISPDQAGLEGAIIPLSESLWRFSFDIISHLPSALTGHIACSIISIGQSMSADYKTGIAPIIAMSLGQDLLNIHEQYVADKPILALLSTPNYVYSSDKNYLLGMIAANIGSSTMHTLTQALPLKNTTKLEALSKKIFDRQELEFWQNLSPKISKLGLATIGSCLHASAIHSKPSSATSFFYQNMKAAFGHQLVQWATQKTTLKIYTAGIFCVVAKIINNSHENPFSIAKSFFIPTLFMSIIGAVDQISKKSP